jgi:predicted Zn-dependent peptidase
MIDNIIGLFDTKRELYGGSNEKNSFFKQTEYCLYDMSNGMSSLLIPLDNATTVTVGIFIRAGSVDESNHKYGIAHFLEHMMFKGTTKRSSEQLMYDLDSIGAQYNAMTSYEYTGYHISGNPMDIEMFLDVIIDLYLNPIFPNKDINNERNVVIEELRMGEDQNHRKLIHGLYEFIYKDVDEDYARPIIGFKETLKEINREDLIRFRKEFYKPSNCLFCVCGNFDLKSVKSQIKKLFSVEMTKYESEKKRELFYDNILKDVKFKPLTALKHFDKQYLHIPRKISQTIIYLTFRTFNHHYYNNSAINLICDVLSNGFSSKLFDLLRNKLGVSYYNSSVNRTNACYGLLTINVGVGHMTVIDTIKNILDELSRTIKVGMTEQELSKVKRQNETEMLFRFKDADDYFMYYGIRYTEKLPLYSISDMMENIRRITLEDVNKIFRMIFTKENLIVGTIGKLPDDYDEKIVKIIENFGKDKNKESRRLRFQ